MIVPHLDEEIQDLAGLAARSICSALTRLFLA